MTVEELDKEIERIYRWWAVEAPGVTPREHGYLGAVVGGAGSVWRALS